MAPIRVQGLGFRECLEQYCNITPTRMIQAGSLLFNINIRSTKATSCLLTSSCVSSSVDVSKLRMIARSPPCLAGIFHSHTGNDFLSFYSIWEVDVVLTWQPSSHHANREDDDGITNHIGQLHLTCAGNPASGSLAVCFCMAQSHTDYAFVVS